MDYSATIHRLANNPQGLELAYQDAAKAGHADAFASAVHEVNAELGDNLLLAAWHYRLMHTTPSATRRFVAWPRAIPLAALTGLVLWLLSDDQRFILHVTNPFSGVQHDVLPLILLLAAPIAAVAIVVYLAAAGGRRWRRAAAVALSLAALSAYVLVAYPHTGPRVFQEQYLILMVLQLGLLSWAGIGAYALGGQSDAANRFAFLLKSFEFAVVAGLFATIGGVFTGITFGLFDALGVTPPVLVMRLFVAGGAGLVSVLGAALVVDPKAAPLRQPFDQGPSQMVTLLLRLLLPLALVVAVVYVVFIPANFRAPLEHREVLIAFDAMLFAVIGLLVGAAPLSPADVDERLLVWLRRAFVALAALAVLVGIYALGAIVSRTLADRLTPNRVTFIGWTVVNIGVLGWLLVKQWRPGPSGWLSAFHEACADAMLPYVAWSVLTLAALPWVFGIDQGEAASLPAAVQHIAFEEPYPVLLKCSGSRHVYLLEGGEKRWIKDIPTFEAQGFKWRDVEFISCDDLDAVPTGEPIPPDAGSPPDE